MFGEKKKPQQRWLDVRTRATFVVRLYVIIRSRAIIIFATK